MEINIPGEETPVIPPSQDPPLLHKLKEFISQNYEPSTEYTRAIKFSTQEIFDKLQKVFPSGSYNTESIAMWLHEKGFSFYDEGEMNFVWLLKEVE